MSEVMGHGLVTRAPLRTVGIPLLWLLKRVESLFFVEQYSYVVCTSEKDTTMSHSINKGKYPSNWKKVSRLIRGLAQGTCEWCHKPSRTLSVHHVGAPRPNGRKWTKGNHCDKHDLRRENLVAICFECHDQVEQIGAIAHNQKKRKKRRQAKLAAHRALNIGTGLIMLETIPARRTIVIPFAVLLQVCTSLSPQLPTITLFCDERERNVIDGSVSYLLS